jgi:pimeloyl-ACP methyl ester carboxylesterase
MFSNKNRHALHLILPLIVLLINILFAQNTKSFQEGLIGILYDDTKMTRPASIWYLGGVDSDSILWETRNDFSAHWVGYIKAPISGQIHFYAEVDNEIKLVIDGVEILNTWNEAGKSSGKGTFIAGMHYPLLLEYRQISGRSYMRLFWQWQDQKKQIIPSNTLFFSSDQKEDVEDNFKSMVNIDLDALDFGIASIIEIHTIQDVIAKRQALIEYLWGTDGYPVNKMPIEIVKGINDTDFASLTNLKRIDRLTVDMESGLNSIAYHFHPLKANGELVVYHQGHNGKFSVGIRTINAFLEKGYNVIALSMPLLGMNKRPVINFKRFGKMIIHSHDQMAYLQPPQGNPIKYFLEPVAVVLNYAKKFKYQRTIMVGISGGGWTTTLCAAIDPRIVHSFPTAGSLPNYLRARDISKSGTLGDYEQQDPGLYRTANYLELYIMGAAGEGRRQLQILNEFDACCFRGTGFKTYKDIIKNILKNLGSGSFDVFLDSTHRLHQISPRALKIIFEDLKNN